MKSAKNADFRSAGILPAVFAAYSHRKSAGETSARTMPKPCDFI
jgi:hypothetical protein